MKRTLLTCCILAATLCLAKAQVAKQAFNNRISNLSSSLDFRNTDNVKRDVDSLNTLMKEQIAYLQSYIKTLQAEDNDPAHKKNKIAMQADAVLITKMTSNLTTDNNLYNTIQQLLNAYTPPKDSVIIGDYNAFAATLQ
jgi:paraquat-inducible protein B